MSLSNAKLPSLKDKIEAKGKVSEALAVELEELDEELSIPPKKKGKGKKN